MFPVGIFLISILTDIRIKMHLLIDYILFAKTVAVKKAPDILTGCVFLHQCFHSEDIVKTQLWYTNKYKTGISESGKACQSL